MWLPSALLLLILPGCFSIHGPKTARGPERGSVTLQCHYDEGWENYRKWWCRGADWGSCEILITTTGSEQEVKGSRMSIRDNHKSHTLTVTMENLRKSDAGTYWCGIEKYGFDPADKVKVTVVPESPTSAPKPLTASPGDIVRTATAASLTSLPSTTPRTPSSNLRTFTSPLSRSLLCNIHVLFLLCLKVTLLGGILCAVMWLCRTSRTSRGTESQPGQENLSSHVVHARSTDSTYRTGGGGTS